MARGRSSGRPSYHKTVAASTGTHTPSDAGPATFPVELIYKPKPVYMEEAQKVNLEGKALLEVVFGANGQLRVNRVVRGLDMDSMKLLSAPVNEIKFKPAQRNGQAVDSTNIVRVTFQLGS